MSESFSSIIGPAVSGDEPKEISLKAENELLVIQIELAMSAEWT
jgi:hypothetical protein